MYLNQTINEENIDENLSSSESKILFPIINSNTENNYGKIDEDNNHLFEYMRRAKEKKENENVFIFINENELNKSNDDISSDDKISNIEILQNINTNNLNYFTQELKLNLVDSSQNSKQNIQNNSPEKNYNDITFQKDNNDLINKKRKFIDNDNKKNKKLIYFFNNHLLKANNDIIKKAGCKFYFNKLPRELILDLFAENKKDNFQMTLFDVYTKKELYNQKNIKSHFEPNLEVLKKLHSDKYINIMEQSGLEKKLKMKVDDLYQEFLNSNENKKAFDKYKETISDDNA